jgi:uncharacterized protein YecE (DUF72 family)
MQRTANRARILVGTAGWSVPRAAAGNFPEDGTHLERYARVLPCAEINSSFYRPHARKVYEKWAAQTPKAFRFSVKLPKSITHEHGLRGVKALLKTFLEQIGGLGEKLGPVLVQLPGSLPFEAAAARAFFDLLRKLHDGAVVCEPRHATWFEPRADALLTKHRIARVAADPPRIDAARQPGGWQGPALKRAANAVAYYRLHGSPRIYWSRYTPERIQLWSDELVKLSAAGNVYCIFDNTASGAAVENALEMQAILAGDGGREPRAATRRSHYIASIQQPDG